jgi:mRNA-degrading endonuclease RelE of RelBE toxin-antitoxin system
MRVELSEQVVTFFRSQAPDPRRKLRFALRKLASESGDIRVLEGPLQGYHRLRVGSFRVIFVYAKQSDSTTCIRCLFAERRDTVYAVFTRMLERQILEE